MRVGRMELVTGRTFLIVLMAITILPFISIFVTALHPSGTVPNGLEWPADPQWGNFVEAFEVANMTTLLGSSVYIVVAVVPISLVISTMAAFAIGLLRIPGSRVLLFLFVFGLTLPFGGIIVPLYYLERAMGIYNTRLAIVLPLIGLYMPFAVFWMRAHFVNTCRVKSQKPPVLTEQLPGICSGESTSHLRGLQSHHSEFLCPSGHGINFCLHWYSWKTPHSVRWLVH